MRDYRSNTPIPTMGEYDDLIRRLEIDLAWQNVRMENCKDPYGTLADYLRKRIGIIGIELTNVRKDRVAHHGKIKQAKVSHRIDFEPKETGRPASRLDGRRKADKTGNRGKH